MTLPHFSVRDVSYALQLTGYIITVTTDVPVHLFMRWTVSLPRRHFDPELKRGTWFPVKVRFCFVEYHDNEQEEAGDTLTHTFIKLNWPECNTRYFYFYGKMSGVWSPSESPLFNKHFKLPKMDGPYYLQLDNDLWTKWTRCLKSGQPYLVTHGEAEATAINTSPTRYAEQSKLGTNYYLIDRKPIYFDTSVLPGGAFVYGAILSQYIDWIVGNQKEIVLFAAPDLHAPPTKPDYGYMRGLTTGEISTLLVADQKAARINSWKINAAGLASINKTGLTKWAWRTRDDVNATAPNSSIEGVYIDRYPEHLTVIYYTPS